MHLVITLLCTRIHKFWYTSNHSYFAIKGILNHKLKFLFHLKQVACILLSVDDDKVCINTRRENNDPQNAFTLRKSTCSFKISNFSLVSYICKDFIWCYAIQLMCVTLLVS